VKEGIAQLKQMARAIGSVEGAALQPAIQFLEGAKCSAENATATFTAELKYDTSILSVPMMIFAAERVPEPPTRGRARRR
jgi:hypothetical protein